MIHMFDFTQNPSYSSEIKFGQKISEKSFAQRFYVAMTLFLRDETKKNQIKISRSKVG